MLFSSYIVSLMPFSEKRFFGTALFFQSFIFAKVIISPYFNEDEKIQSATVTQYSYQELIGNFFIPRLQEVIGYEFHRQIYQQDSASSHTFKDTLNERLISLKTDFIWPPHSPDFDPLDFYLWGAIKDKVYTQSPKTVNELKFYIKKEIEKIKVDECGRVSLNLIKRFLICKEHNCCYLLPNLLF